MEMMAELPARSALPRYLAPLPGRLEDFALRWAWPIVAVNLVGTLFGVWYYGIHPIPRADPLVTGQFAAEPVIMWPIVPDSPTATLFIAGSLAAWKLGRPREWLNMLAFFGCIKLGVWTPYVLALFKAEFSYLHPAMYHFLFWSHLAMVAEAFLIHRYSAFPRWAVAVAVIWYGGNDILDYFVPIVGDPHHTWIPAEFVNGTLSHTVPAHDYAAAGAVALTIAATILALATGAKKRNGSAVA